MTDFAQREHDRTLTLVLPSFATKRKLIVPAAANVRNHPRFLSIQNVIFQSMAFIRARPRVVTDKTYKKKHFAFATLKSVPQESSFKPNDAPPNGRAMPCDITLVQTNAQVTIIVHAMRAISPCGAQKTRSPFQTRNISGKKILSSPLKRFHHTPSRENSLTRTNLTTTRAQIPPRQP